MSTQTDQEIQKLNLLLEEGFSAKQAEAIVDLGLIDPHSLSEENLSEYWETYRALYTL